MHNWAKSIMECVKSKIDSMGMDNLDRECVEELKAWTCIAKDVAEYDYYYHITEAMEKPENQYGKNYDENGRYNKRGYDEMYDMTPSYRNNSHMYYDGAVPDINRSVRNYSDTRYERARKGYEEAKKMNPESENMDKLKDVFEELKTEMKELKPHMSQNGKSYAHNELINMANTMM